MYLYKGKKIHTQLLEFFSLYLEYKFGGSELKLVVRELGLHLQFGHLADALIHSDLQKCFHNSKHYHNIAEENKLKNIWNIVYVRVFFFLCEEVEG